MMTDEQRRAFESLSPEEQERLLEALQALLDAGDAAARRRLQRAKNEARRAAFALRKAESAKRAADDDVQLDMDVWGGLFDDEGNE